MKRINYILCIITVLFLLTGCNSNKINTNNQKIEETSQTINKEVNNIKYNIVYYDVNIEDKKLAVEPVTFTDDFGSKITMINASTIKFLDEKTIEVNVNTGAGFEKQKTTYYIKDNKIYFEIMGDSAVLRIEDNKLIVEKSYFDLSEPKEFVLYEE